MPRPICAKDTAARAMINNMTIIITAAFFMILLS